MTSLTSNDRLSAQALRTEGRAAEPSQTMPCWRIGLMLGLCLWIGSLGSTDLRGQNPVADDSREKILADQQRLAEQYELLEKKLFSLYQYEQDQNQQRSELLQKAYQSSREKLTLQKFNAVVQQLRQSRFRNAEKSQDQISAELQSLLDLLQSEDRSQRVREQMERYKEYIKEINRTLRVQQGIRGQGERGENSQRLQNDQQKNAERTAKLQQEFRDNEQPQQDPAAANPSADLEPSPASDSPDPGQADPGQPTGKPAQSTPTPAGPPNSQGQPGESPAPPDGDRQSAESPAPSENPVQQNLQQAEQQMREAQQKLQAAEQQESVEKMRQAERQLQQAKQELERILRQLRQEEIERTLASLESRFRRMLELQIKIHEDTITLHAVQATQAADATEVQSAKLAARERALLTEAARGLLVLEDDGSSIAVVASLEQVQIDMQQVTDRLAAAKTDAITQEIQLGIVETLSFLVEVFEQAQKEENGQPNPGQGPGQEQPGEQALINQIAELKLIRGLQQQILKRHTRYSRLLPDPEDAIGHSDDPGIRQALEQLSQRQQSLQRITRDIVVGKNR